MGKTVTIDESVWVELQAALKKAGLITSDAEAGPTEDESLASRVKEARILRGWSRMMLAKEAGVSESTIGLLEDNGREPQTATLQKLASALGKNPLWLLSGKGREGRAEA